MQATLVLPTTKPRTVDKHYITGTEGIYKPVRPNNKDERIVTCCFNGKYSSFYVYGGHVQPFSPDYWTSITEFIIMDEKLTLTFENK